MLRVFFVTFVANVLKYAPKVKMVPVEVRKFDVTHFYRLQLII